jgi:hypothetical protein
MMTEVCTSCGGRWESEGVHDWPSPHECRAVVPRRLARECPTCGAQPGTPCVKIPSGREMYDVHQPRLAPVAVPA